MVQSTGLTLYNWIITQFDNMTILDKLFTFPIILINMDNNDSNKNLLPKAVDEDLDMVEGGQAQYPYYDFVGIEDRWIPNDIGLARAKDGKFNACAVKFANMPQLLVPWRKEKFKGELAKFIEDVTVKEKQKIQRNALRLLSPEQARKVEEMLRDDMNGQLDDEED